jgi:hypothetical protein
VVVGDVGKAPLEKRLWGRRQAEHVLGLLPHKVEGVLAAGLGAILEDDPRNAVGQPPEPGLAVLEDLLGPLALIDVEMHAGGAGYGAVFVPIDHLPDRLDPLPVAAFRPHADLRGVGVRVSCEVLV